MGSGGPREGSGRPPKFKDTVRSRVVRIHVTQTEYDVLSQLADQWDIPIATAAYGLVADAIATCRKAKPLAMPEKLWFAASKLIVRWEPLAEGGTEK